jgi:hypothetical protein
MGNDRSSTPGRLTKAARAEREEVQDFEHPVK